MLAAAAHNADGVSLGFAALLPFATMLLAIAFLPLLAGRFWHRHYEKVAAAIAIPAFLWYAFGRGGEWAFWRTHYLHTAR